MPHIEQPYPYEKMFLYPHMRPADMLIWTRFIDEHPNRFIRVFYDFHCGDPVEHDEACSDCVAGAWNDLTRWKCDVLAEDNDAYWAIEVKPHANAKALGQALSYAILIALDLKSDKPVMPAVLTNELIPSTVAAAKEMGVEVWVV